MSGICGYVGNAHPDVLERMLDAIDYRGDGKEVATAEGVGLGYRWWTRRPGKSPGIYKEGPHLVAVAGTFAPPLDNPAKSLMRRISPNIDDSLDGAFAGAWWDGQKKRLTLIRDPFGIRSLYHANHQGVFYFASELKQLLAIPGIPAEPDFVALHKYLTFSFVPGDAVPIKGIHRLLAGNSAILEDGKLGIALYFNLEERIDPQFEDQKIAAEVIGTSWREAVAKRLNGESEVGLFLSGGIDSAGVAYFLKRLGVKTRAFTLDFGERSVEKEQAECVAKKLEIPLTHVRVNGSDLSPILMDLVWKLDLPFGDAVTGPQYLLCKAAREASLSAVFNGEGGDQFFGGWTNKPMISAQLFGDLYGEESSEELYLRSYHKFYGLEEPLYSAFFKDQVGGPGTRRAHLKPYLQHEGVSTFLNRVRLADISLKGSQNILPRAERISNAWGLDARVPLFDRALAEASFRLPTQLKLKGACEKFVLKLVLQNKLPPEIVWRRKYGMNVPITDWVLGPMRQQMGELLGLDSLKRRGYFKPEYVQNLLEGRNDPHETRKRRIGEKVWALAMLEAWLRVFVDGRGKKPGGAT